MTSQRSVKRTGFALMGVLLGAALLCGAFVYERSVDECNDPESCRTPPTTVRVSEKAIIGVLFNSTSDQDQLSLLGERVDRTMALARQIRASVEIYAGTARTDTERRLLGRGNFDPGVNNSYATVPLRTYDDLREAVAKGIDGLTPSEATDVPGALRLIAQRGIELRNDGVEHVTAYLWGDLVSTVAGCDFSLSPTSPSSWAKTAGACLGSDRPDLRGIEVVLVGAGQDTRDGLPPEVGRAAAGIVKQMVLLCGGAVRTDAG